MAANKGKPRGVKLGTSISNLLASMPWLKNKAFLIPAIATVLVLSTVGVVLAVQATNSPSVDQESAEVSLDDSGVEVVAEPVIGPECVEGEPVCEEVKHILLEIDNWENDVFPFTYEQLVESMMYQHNVSREFAASVINAVEFDWGDDPGFAASSKSETASENSDRPRFTGGSTSGGASGSSSPATACRGGVDLCKAVTEIFTRGHFDFWIRENLVKYLMSTYSASRATVEAAIDSTGYNWARSAGSSAGSSSGEALSEAPVEDLSSLDSAKETAKSIIDNAFFSRRDAIEAMEYLGYSRQLSTQAIDSLNVNWNLEAQQQAQDFVRQGGQSRAWLLYYLEFEQGRTSSEALYGVDSLNLDYFEQAVRATEELLTLNPCDAQGVLGTEAVFDSLYYDQGFEADEADHGINSQLENNDDGWWWSMYPECVVAF